MPTNAAAAGFFDTARSASPKRVRWSKQVQEDGERGRAAEHDEMVAANEELSEVEGELRKRRERIGPIGEDDGDDLLELHPDREARDHRGERSPPPHRPEAHAFDVEAGQHRAGQSCRGDGEEAGLELDVQQGAREDPEHDRGTVGEVEASHHPENQGEADREQRIGRADEDAVERYSGRSRQSPVDHHGSAAPETRRAPRVRPPFQGRPA